MSKTKMRCNTCGKWFQSANAKELTCPDCMQKARREKMVAKTAPPTMGGPGANTPPRPTVPPPPPKPKPAAGGTGQSHWLDTMNDVKIGQPDQPTRPKLPPSPAPRDNRSGPERVGIYRGPSPSGPGNSRDDRGVGGPSTSGSGGYRDRDREREGGNRSPNNYREGGYRSNAPYRVGGGMGLPDTAEPRPRQPMEGGLGRGPRPGSGPGQGPRPGGPGEGRERFQKDREGKPFRPAKPRVPKLPPQPKKEKIPPPAPFVPTPEQVTQVEVRYHELATPIEFDGIRTQIAQELSIPKTAVKKIVKEFRDREHIPSWWEAQTYKGDVEELEKIKALYLPLLPLPEVGVHKKIAEELSLKSGEVYQAIKALRVEMNLPQFNDPALHGLELRPKKKKETPVQEEEKAETPEATAEEIVSPPAPETPTAAVEESSAASAAEIVASVAVDGDKANEE